MPRVGKCEHEFPSKVFEGPCYATFPHVVDLLRGQTASSGNVLRRKALENGYKVKGDRDAGQGEINIRPAR